MGRILGFLKARLARRVVLLFVVCALLPVGTFSVIAYRHVRGQLERQSAERLSEVSRETGMAVLQGLHLVEAALLREVDRRRTGGAAAAGGGAAGKHGGERRSVEAGDRGVAEGPRIFGIREWVVGGPEAPPGLAGAGDARAAPRARPGAAAGAASRALPGGDAGGGPGAADSPPVTPPGAPGPVIPVPTSRLRVGAARDGGLVPWLGHPLGPEEGRWLWARLDPGFLVAGPDALGAPKDRPVLPRGLRLCIVVGRAAWPDCPVPVREALAEARAAGGNAGHAGHLTWVGSEPYRAAYWSLYLRPEYGSREWTIVVSEPESLMLAPVAGLRRRLILALALALLVVVLLSVVQVRRNLDPLEKLQEGTRRLAARDFEARVEIESGDEFEELAGTFNGMAEELASLVGELERLNVETVAAFGRAVDAKSRWTAGHSERVTRRALALGREVGLSGEELDLLERGGLLHDVGKIGIPSAILDKPGKLTPEERRIIESHPVIGARIVEPISRFRGLVPIVRHHHERFDGEGYPDGLAGEDIDLLARITAVSDIYDALTSARPYRAPSSSEEALQVLREGSGSMLDPELVEAFCRVMVRGDPAAGDLRDVA